MWIARQKIIYLIVAVVLLKGLLWAVVVPAWVAPDEPKYMEYTRILFEERRVPNETETEAAGHPLLYPLITLIPYSLGLPFGEDAQIILVRIVGIIFEALSIVLVYKTVKLLFPESLYLQIIVPLSMSFNPQYSFIMASINSDTLLNFLVVAFIYFFSLYFYRSDPMHYKSVIILVLITAFGVLAKQRFYIVLPFLLLLIGFDVLRRKKTFSKDLVNVATAAILAVLSIFAAVTVINNSFATGLSRSLELTALTSNYLPQRSFTGFWGNFGWFQYIPQRVEVYAVLGIFTLVGFVGFVLLVLINAVNFLSRFTRQTTVFSVIQLTSSVAATTGHNEKEFLAFESKRLASLRTILPTLRAIRLTVDAEDRSGVTETALKTDTQAASIFRINQLRATVFAFLIMLTFLNYYSLSIYEIRTGGGNARYLFPSIFPIYLFLTLGWYRFVPDRFHKIFTIALLTCMFALNAQSLFFIVVPFYYGAG